MMSFPAQARPVISRAGTPDPHGAGTGGLSDGGGGGENRVSAPSATAAAPGGDSADTEGR